MTCVFIHGLGQIPSSWDKVTAYLSNDIHIYRPCLSSIVGERQITYDNLYEGFENECNRVELPLCLCGISLGAVLALEYTLNNPQKVQSLILIAPQYKMPKLLLSIQNTVFRVLPKKAFQETGFSKREIITLSTSMKKIDFTSALRQIMCPCYIICGQKDKANQKAARLLADHISNAILSFVENAGHEVNIDAPAKLADFIKEAWFHE